MWILLGAISVPGGEDVPPPATTQPFPAWQERGAPRRGFLPCFHPTGRRQGIILCLLLSMPSAQNSPYPEWRILGVAQAATLRYGCADVFVNLCCWSEKAEALSSFGARTSSMSLDSALHQDDL